MDDDQRNFAVSRRPGTASNSRQPSAHAKNLIALGEGFTTEFKLSGTSNLGRERQLCKSRLHKLPVSPFRCIPDLPYQMNRPFFLDPGSESGVTREKAGMTEADLGVKSIPRNPLLFGMLYRMVAVEHIGSGIKRIRNLCREYGVADCPGIFHADSVILTPRP
jgi:hypothetical protein